MPVPVTNLMKAYKEFSDRVETVAVDKMGKSERVKDLLDKRLGKLSKREISDIYPDISVTTIENPYNAPTYQPLGRWDGIFHYIPPSF